jgi:hypothetical protein
MTSGPAVVNAPETGLWRVARGDNPLLPVRTVEAHGRRSAGANRFDPVHHDYGVLYFGTSLEACFAETLARLRPSLELLALVDDDWRAAGFMPPGNVPADWRQRRTAVHVRLPPSTLFVDVDDPLTHQYLRAELAPALAALGIQDLDVSTVRGPDRRITQMISEWAYMAAQDDQPRYAGLRYCSRLGSEWECWALFDDDELTLDVLETLPITYDMVPLQKIASTFDLTVF